MPSKDYIPGPNPEFLAFVTNYSSIITAGPALVGLTTGNATTLAEYVATFATAQEAASNPATRGSATILARNLARKPLETYVRQTAKQIQGTMFVTDEQRQALGLTIAKPRTPSHPPVEIPVIDILSMVGSTLTLRLHNGSLTSRARPADARGAAIFTFIGPTPPNQVSEWTFRGNTSKTKVVIDFDPSLAPGTKVWTCAFWFNDISESGMACEPVGAQIQFGGMMSTESLKIAA